MKSNTKKQLLLLLKLIDNSYFTEKNRTYYSDSVLVPNINYHKIL